MTSVPHKLRLSITSHQYEEWCRTAASQGISVQDFVRRAVDAYNPATTVKLRDLATKIDDAVGQVAQLRLSLVALDKVITSAGNDPSSRGLPH